ncbi:MAG TPA: dephospho-CoA kinase [Solirubrobacterales bacterium]|nr:dephospho-CoA kinase [Solirubrobacterales bacterium]
MAPPLTIGLTGGIAAGKSEALAAFGRLGAATLSSDAVVHDLLEGESLRAAMTERWGPEVAPPGAPTDRGRIGGIVFADPAELGWLESKIHPAVGAATAAWIEALPADVEFAVIEVPLLFEGGREKVFDTTVSVVAAEDVRRERAAARGHALVDAREARQLTQEEKADRAEHVIVNDGSVADLEAALSALLAKLQG